MSLDNLNNNIYPLSLDGLTTINADFITVNGATLDPNSYVPYTGASAAVNLGNKKITTVYIPVNPEDLVNKFFTDGKYLTIVNANSTYLKIVDAASTYATITSLSNYLTIANADSTYLKINDAVVIYATKASLPSYEFSGNPTIVNAPSATDDSTKIPTTHWVNYSVSLTYATIASLSNYLTTANADTTYLKITDAAGTYATITSLSNYLTTAAAAGTYATITSLNLKANSANPTFSGTVILPNTVSFISPPSSGTGTLLAINGSGNIITTSSTINQTATFTSSPSTYYLPFVSSPSTAAFVPLVNAGITCDPYDGLIRSNNITANNLIQTYNMKIGSVPEGLLGIDSAGNVISGVMRQTQSTTNAEFNVIFTQYAGTGTFNAFNESVTNSFTFNPSTLTLKTSKMRITNVPTGTQLYLLAVDSAGNVIRGTTTPLQQVRTLVNADYYIPFVSSFTNGDFLPLIENRVKLNPSTGTISMFNLVLSGNANLASITFNSIPPAGTVSSYLAINSSGNVITTAGAGGDAYLANNQTFTGSNTFDSPLMCNNINPKPLHGLIIDGNGNGIVVFRSLGITKARVDNYGFDADIISNITLYTQNITSPFSTSLTLTGANDASLYSSGTNNYGCNTSHQFTVNSVNNFAISANGLWMPVSSSKSFYITDNYPNIGTGTYSRYFGLNGIIYQDFYNQFQWRRSPNINGSAETTLMSLDSNGLTLNNAVGINQPQLVFAGSGIPTIRMNGGGMNWFMNNTTNMGYFDAGGYGNGGNINGLGWRINAHDGLTLRSERGVYLECALSAGNPTINARVPHFGTGLYKWGDNGWFSYGGAFVVSYDPVGNVTTGIGMGVSFDNNWCYFDMVKPGNFWAQGIFETGHANWYVNRNLAAYITAGGWTNVSDERCKHDIRDLSTTKSLQRILKCKPKYYKRIMEELTGKNPIPHKQEDINRVHIGLLAQEVQGFNPHCVSTWHDKDESKENERLGIQYNDFVIHLIGAVQEQQKQINDQKEVIKNQEERIKHLEESILQHNILLSQIVDKLNSKN